MLDFWPACGFSHLTRDTRGHLAPAPGWWAHWLDRPELALVAESCPAEIALHRALRADPLRPVTPADLETLRKAVAAISLPTWAEICDKSNPGCSAAWKATVGKVVGIK